MPTHTLCSRNKSSAKSNAARSFLTCAFRPTKPAAIVRAGCLITVWLEVRVLPGPPLIHPTPMSSFVYPPLGSFCKNSELRGKPAGPQRALTNETIYQHGLNPT